MKPISTFFKQTQKHNLCTKPLAKIVNKRTQFVYKPINTFFKQTPKHDLRTNPQTKFVNKLTNIICVQIHKDDL